MKFDSFKDASILRKFTIYLILMSIIPVSVLYYLYTQIKDHGRLEITGENLNNTLILIVTGVGVGYIAMRSIIKEIITMAKASTETIQRVLGPEKIGNLPRGENEITILTRSFSVVTERLEENIRNLELAKKTLYSVLAKVGSGFTSMENIDNFLDLILETVAEAMRVQSGVLLLVDEEQKDFFIKTVYGVYLEAKENYRMRLRQGSFEQVVKAKKPLVMTKFETSELPKKVHQSLFKAPLLCAPLLLHDKLLGVIAISNKITNEPFNDDELNLINNIALQTAVAIENSRLNQDAERTYLETISALALAVEAKDLYSRGHLDRVADYVIRIAKKLNLSEEEMMTLHDAARLHDIGKIGIYDDVLRKPGKLTPEERNMMTKHTEIGESIIKPIRSLRPLCDIIRHHHEFLDGSGYPDGLKGDQISLLTRILTVADIYDALTTDRPYRKASNKEEARTILLDMDRKLDIKVINTLFEVL